MKKAIFLVSIGVLFLASCKEKPPIINLTEVEVTDTTYPGPVPATTDPHHVLIEEFTGQSCSNCPAAHELVHDLANANPGRVHIVGLYKYAIQQTVPVNGSIYDFRDSTASDIGNLVFGGVTAIPNGGVDRVPVAGNIVLDKSAWSGTVNSRLEIQDSLNLAITSVWDSANQQAKITATIIYTKSVYGAHNLSIMVVEDSMVDKQELPLGAEEDHYVFTNVFRGMATSIPWGDPIYPTIPVKEPGRVVKKVYTYKLKSRTPAINPNHCKVIAFVNSTSSTNKEVMQAVEAKLK